MQERESIWRRYVTKPILMLLRQGITADKLALAIALGFAAGMFPVIGTTTILCAAAAGAFRLNQVAAQVGNWLSYPFMLLAVIPFVRIGELVSGRDPFPLALDQLQAAARGGAVALVGTFSGAIGHAILGWAIVMPLATAILFFALLPLFRKWKPAPRS